MPETGPRTSLSAWCNETPFEKEGAQAEGKHVFLSSEPICPVPLRGAGRLRSSTPATAGAEAFPISESKDQHPIHIEHRVEYLTRGQVCEESLQFTGSRHLAAA